MNQTAPWDDAQVVYVTQHDEQAPPAEDVEHDEALLRAVIRAIQRSPRLHAELVVALEHKV